MEMKGLPLNADKDFKNRICDSCTVASGGQLNKSGKQVWLDPNQLSGILPSLKEELDTKSFYEPIIRLKLINLETNFLYQEHFRQSAKNFEIARQLANRINDETRPDLAIVYSAQYSINSGYCASAKERGIPVLFVEGSSSPYNRYSSVRIWNWHDYGLENPIAKSENYLKAKISLGSVMHFRVVKRALTHSSYSTKKENINIRKKLGIPAKNKILVAILSSSDEVFSGYVIGALSESRLNSKVFQSQQDWILETIKLVRNMSDVNLLIRVHPREFPNHRDKIRSEMSSRWESLAKQNQLDRVHWNFAEDNISLYDILDYADVVVTGWSSVSIEALFKRIPVVTYDKDLCSLPYSLTLTGDTFSEYKENIYKALRKRKSFKLKIRALRYISFRDFENTYRVGGEATEARQFFFVPIFGKVFKFIYRKSSRKQKHFLNKRINQNKDKERVYSFILQQVENVKKDIEL